MGKECDIGYILSLGVHKKYRRNGIGSLLLDALINHLTTSEKSKVKAIFLHVLTTNQPAILFYEKRRYTTFIFKLLNILLGFIRNYFVFVFFFRFRMHQFLPYYYSIKGYCKDGFTYVLYINGGHPPWTLLGMYQSIISPHSIHNCNSNRYTCYIHCLRMISSGNKK